MGKPTSFCVDDHLQKMSSSSTKTQCVVEDAVELTVEPFKPSSGNDARAEEGPTATATSTAVTSPTAAAAEDKTKEPIPKLYISRSLLRVPGKRKMVDGIIRRLSIGPESVQAVNQRSLEFASKVFRKRANSSGHGYEIGPKIQVIDNLSEPVPGMLPTPVVRGGSSTSSGMSVFKSQTCDTVLRKYTGPAATVLRTRLTPWTSVPKATSDDSLASSPASSPSAVSPSYRPKLKTPPLNEFFRKPRTVAEKRLYLQQSPLEYKVLDFENSVYHLVKKLERFKNDATFRAQVELLIYSAVPTNRNIWKALLYLNAEVGSYEPWHLNIDGHRLRLLGATGTVVLDDLEPVSSKIDNLNGYVPPKKPSWCCAKYRLRKFNNEESILAQLHRSNANQSTACPASQKLIRKRKAEMLTMKPGPLSSKVRRLSNVKRKDSLLGPLEVFELPVKTMTAVPELNKRQPQRVCSYLKLVVPETNMTQEWLNYSLSVLQSKSSVPAEGSAEEVSFKFSIPYKNDQRKILVRRMNSRKRGECRTEDFDEQMRLPLTFAAVARKEGETFDPEVEKILTEMIESVALSFSEDFFIRNDPDLTYTVDPLMRPPLAPPMKPSPEAPQAMTIKKRRQSEWTRSTLRSELRRLNVAIIDAGESKSQATENCTKDECKFGCVCDTISRLDGLSSHCTKEECIFGCKCSAAERQDGEQRHLRQMRDDSIRFLAPAQRGFTSAVVLTNSNTILMSNSEDRKRNRRQPKRYFDYTVNGDTNGEDEADPVVTEGPREEAWSGICKKDFGHEDIEKMRHCSVNLPHIPQLEVLEPWCIVHELYRCFCGNKRIEGRPFKLHTEPDGTIRANVKETLLLNSRRRPVTFARDESQDALERLPVTPRYDAYCSRCTPTDFTEQISKNRKNSELVNTKVRLADRSLKSTRLQTLIDQCLSMDGVQAPPQRPRRSSSTSTQQNPPKQRSAEERSRQRQQFMEEAGNELGLKIESVCTVDEEEFDKPQEEPRSKVNGTVPRVVRSEGPVTYHRQLSNLKQKLLLKLNFILESVGRVMLNKSVLKKLSFVRYSQFKKLLTANNMHLVELRKSASDDTVEGIILTRELEGIEVHFPDNHCVRVDTTNTRVYLSKFLINENTKMQSNNIFIVLEGSGKNYWNVRGCQFIRDVVGRIRILSEHTGRLREYAKVATATQSNLDVMQMNMPNNARLAVKLPVNPGERWLMMTLQKDFSDISHPHWRGLLSCKHIKQAIELAQTGGKTIRVIRGNQQPNVYATPNYSNRIFVGPFATGELSRMHLYQRMDNSLYLREEYEAMMSTQLSLRTTGYWLTNDQLNAAIIGNRGQSSSLSLSNDTSTATNTPSTPPNVLPELSLTRATIKQEGSAAEPPTPVVSITTMSSRSVLKPIDKRVPGSVPVPSPSPALPKAAVPCFSDEDFTCLKDVLLNREVSTFRVGNTTVQRRTVAVPDAVPGPSSGVDAAVPVVGGKSPMKEDESQLPPPPPVSETADVNENDTYESEDDDVILVEDNEKIIDLDEWERVQQESSDEEDATSPSTPTEAEVSKVEAASEFENVPAEDNQDGAVSGASHEAATLISNTSTEKEVDKRGEAESTVVSLDDSIPSSGYFKSNIPSLGYIPAKILNGIVTLSLPFRRMPIRIGINCVDRYMWKYLQNSISACFPQNLKIKWTFINSYFPTEDSTLKLEPTSEREFTILTEYGVINVMKDVKSETDIPDPSVYLKYLASRLCVLVFKKLGVYTAHEIIEETLKIIKQERYQILKNNRELSTLSMRRSQLQTQLNVLVADVEAMPGRE